MAVAAISVQGHYDRGTEAWTGGGLTAVDLSGLGPRAKALVLMVGGICGGDDLRVASADDDRLVSQLGLSTVSSASFRAGAAAGRPTRVRAAVEDLAREPTPSV